MMDHDYLKLFVEETSFYNNIVLGSLLPERLWSPLPHFFRGWLRNYVGGVLVYFISGFLWCLYIYYLKCNVYFPKGWAVHPLEGILLGLSHVVALFLVPMHFTTLTIFYFMEAMWAANIHDCIDGKIWPVMGAGYHTIHHTTSRHNYGHYTIWMDWMFGTLRDPEEDDKAKKL